MKRLLKSLPFLGEYFYYHRLFFSRVGFRFYSLLGLWFVAALLDGLGIALLLPLLKAGDMGGELHGKGQYLLDFLNWVGIPVEVYSILLFIGSVFLLKGGVKFFQALYQARISAHLMKRMKSRFLDLYARVDHQYFNSKNSGHFINIINGQVNKFISTFSTYCKFSGQFLTAAVYIAFAFFLNWLFSTMAVLIGGVVLLFLRLVARFVKDVSIKMSHESSRLQKFIVQTLHAMKFLKATDRTDRLEDAINRSIAKLAGYKVELGYARGITKAIREPVTVFSLIGIILVQILYFEQPIAPIVVTLFLFYRAMNTMIMFQGSWQGVMNSVGGVRLVLEEEERLLRNQESNRGEELKGFRDSVRFEEVDFAYEGDGPVIRGFDLRIGKNETVALVGESGAGKSTLTDLLTLLLKPSQGDIKIDGRSYKDLNVRSWRRLIGYVPQETVVFDDTVANNICLWACDPEGPACMERIRNAAEKAHCSDFIQEMKDGFNTIVGDRGVRLSGGQKQRIAIARELFRQPELLILDEATSSLDTASEKQIQESIDALKGKVTLVIIAHRLSTIKNVDRIYVLDHGRVVEQGSFEELTNGKGTGKFKEMAEMQKL
ncbi:MAG: ABC transporter ATP-binding protein [Flavobacteriales bacterium]